MGDYVRGVDVFKNKLVRVAAEEGADVNGPASGKPIHSACSNRHTRVTLELIRAGAYPMQADLDGWHGLHLAAVNVDRRMAHVMLEGGRLETIEDTCMRRPAAVIRGLLDKRDARQMAYFQQKFAHRSAFRASSLLWPVKTPKEGTKKRSLPVNIHAVRRRHRKPLDDVKRLQE